MSPTEQSQEVSLTQNELAERIGMIIPTGADENYVNDNFPFYERVLFRPANLSVLTLEEFLTLTERHQLDYLKSLKSKTSEIDGRTISWKPNQGTNHIDEILKNLGINVWNVEL